MQDVDKQVQNLTRGCEQVYTVEELRRKLCRSAETGRPLRVKLGMDPTAADLTLGHTVVLRKMRDFQDCGHRAVLIIGDFTAMIGDPTGRSKTRPMLSPERIDENARTYLHQAGKVLDMSKDKLEIRRNSEWLGRMDFPDVIRMASQMTVARMLERDTFEKRHQQGQEIYIHELFYPLMQARDSVEIHADVELGGTDQTFNNLAGRDFQRAAAQEPQVVVITPLLVGIDGAEKMSKSQGNYVGVTEPPPDMFAKIMSIPDTLMPNYLELLTRMTAAERSTLLDPARTHPRDAKVTLAKTIVTQFHDQAAADAAAEEFFRIHGAGQSGLPNDMPEIEYPASKMVDGCAVPVDLVKHCGFAGSNAQARRLIQERGVRLDGKVLDDPWSPVPITTGIVLQRGKRKFVRLQVR